MTAISHPDGGRSGKATAQVLDTTQPGPAASARERSRAWLRSPVAQGGLALAIYLLVWTLTAYRPVVHHASEAILDQKSMDPNFYVWALRWWPYAVSHGLNPLFSGQIGAPSGHSLVWVTTVPPIALLAAPLTLLVGPVAAFNLLSAIAPPLAGWAAFVLCRRLTRKFWPALIGGAIFGFSAFEMNHAQAGQLNLTYSLLVPVFAYLVVRWWQGGLSSRWFVALVALTLTVQFYLFLETFADLTALTLIALAAAFPLAGRAYRPELLRLTRVTGMAYGIALLLALPYLAVALNSKPPKPARITGMDLASLVIPRAGRTYGIGWLTQAADRQVSSVSTACYVGIPLLVVLVLLAVTYWSSRLVRFLTCMIAFVIVVSLGPALRVDGHQVFRLPWAPVWDLPLLQNAYPARLMLFAFLALAVAAALFLAGPARRLRWVKWPLAVFVALFIALDAAPVVTLPHTSVPTFLSKGTYLKKLTPGETVVVVSSIGNAGMLWQAQSGFYMRLAGGYINAGLNNRTDLPQQVQNLAAASPARVAAFERYVRTDRIGAVLVDMIHEPQWVGIFWRMGLRGHKINHVIVYQLDGCRTCRALTWSDLRS